MVETRTIQAQRHWNSGDVILSAGVSFVVEVMQVPLSVPVSI